MAYTDVARRSQTSSTGGPKEISGATTKETVVATLPGIKNDIIVCAIQGSTSFYGMDNSMGIDALAPFKVYLAIQDMPILSMADFKTQNHVSIEYKTTTTTGATIEDKRQFKFTCISQISGVLGKDWYLYELTNIENNKDWRAPFKELEMPACNVYQGTLKKRLENILKYSGLSENHFDLSGLSSECFSNEKRNDYTLQYNQSYWSLLQNLMQKYSFTCFLDNAGKLIFVDSLSALPKAEKSLLTASAVHPELAENHIYRYAGVFEVREYDERDGSNDYQVEVTGYDPANPTRVIKGSAGKEGLKISIMSGDTTKDEADDTAKRLRQGYRGMRHYLQGVVHTTPPELGKIYKISWKTAGNNGEVREADVVAVKIDYVKTTYSAQDKVSSDLLGRALGIGPHTSNFMVTFAIVDDKVIPCPKPAADTFALAQQTFPCLTLDKDDKSVGKETASKENKMKVSLPWGDVIWVYNVNTLGLIGSLPEAGRPVQVLFNNTEGNFYLLGSTQQCELTSSIKIQRMEKPGKDTKQGCITVGGLTYSVQLTTSDSKAATFTVTAKSIEAMIENTKITWMTTAVDFTADTINVKATKGVLLTGGKEFKVDAAKTQIKSTTTSVSGFFDANNKAFKV